LRKFNLNILSNFFPEIFANTINSIIIFKLLAFYFDKCLFLALYRAFQRFGQAQYPDGGLVLGSSQFSILPKLPLKTMLGLKVFKIESKISNLLC